MTARGTIYDFRFTPDVRRGGRRPMPREHGSERGYQQHRTRHEPACGRCLYAHQIHNEAVSRG